MKELRRIKPPLVYFLRFSRRKATSSTSNFFAETQVFFSDILFRAAPSSGGPTGQAVLRDRRSYGTGCPTGHTVHPGQAVLRDRQTLYCLTFRSGQTEQS